MLEASLANVQRSAAGPGRPRTIVRESFRSHFAIAPAALEVRCSAWLGLYQVVLWLFRFYVRG